ncbi:hypothetical protein AUJ14_02240 [Candidatus Micrarchaeota archaeon CG1_02_55_22]|nr:MAG: hypothetical protein AUJ14_02240 [Candidatus Micrarchaeota archaeon CG1_02_55_22]
MKVVIVNALFHPFTGGVEKHLHELGKHLAGKGVEVHVLTGRLEGTLAEEVLDGIHVHRIPCTEIRVPSIYPPPLILSRGVEEALAKLDAEHDFDLIHLQDRWFPDFNAALLYAKRVHKPFVLTLHNARPLGIAPHYTVLGSLYDEVVGKRILKSADKIISVSSWSAKDVANYGIPLENFIVVHNGIDTKAFQPRRTSVFVRKMGIKGPLLLFVGRIIRQKGLEYAVKAMPLILKKHPDARFVVIGRGNRLEHVKKLVKQMKLEDSVIFPGFVPERELFEALGSCDVFILPSLWEVLPISILEAMSCGRPIVCTTAGGNAELVRDGYNGFVVPKRSPEQLAEAVTKLLDDDALRTHMGENSRKRAVQEFDWEIITDQTIVAYKQILREYAAKPREAATAREAFNELSNEFSKDMHAFNEKIKATIARARR